MVMPSTGCAWFRHLGSLALVWTVIVKVIHADCASGPSILTTEGCTACEDFDICRGFNIASDCVGPHCKTDGNCTFECLPVNAASSSVVVLVEFGNYKSDAEIAGSYNDTKYPDETSEYPSVSNDQVDTLGTIDLSSKVTTFIVSGGTSVSKYPKGKVSRISLTSSFIYLQTEVTKVVLQNLDLGIQVSLLPDYLPMLDYNYLTAVSTENVIDSLTTLSLENNKIDTFEGVFPELEYLYLGNNRLTTIPTAVFSHLKLKSLNLAGNAFSSRYLTTAQVKFLKNLDTLGLSGSDFAVGVECDDTEQSTIHYVTICVIDKDSPIGDESDSSRSNVDDYSNTSSNTNATLTRLALGFVYGISAVVLLGIFFITSSRHKGARYPDVNDTTEYDDDNFSSPESELQHKKKIYSGLYESSGRFNGMTSQSSGFSMGISDSSYEDDDSIDIPVLEACSISTSKFAPSVTTMSVESKNMPIWNDYELLSLQLCVASIKDIEPLGSGGYATVWLVRYRNLQLLASKRLRPERQERKDIWAFVEEIKLVANFDHPNIVSFVGAAWTMESDLQMVMEYMDGGDVHMYLSDPSTPTGWTYQKFTIAISIVEALVYLHSFVPPLLHRDIKSKNVLLSSAFKIKLSDFGKSRFRSENNTMSGGIGTGRNTRGPNGKVLSDTTIMHHVATGKLHPKVRSTCAGALKNLVEQCLVRDPFKRPTAPEIVNELRLIQQEMATSLSKRAPWTTDFIGRGTKR
ncbi:TKL protein kinase [Phytophthora megakarya]|uniref:TKL protein kinase n=1 Tax=Phytophthora megakarya TaxID=4795 RepID=A0A225WUH7_9STRA|nr:TKL protein kinase [Phytophthora megakarya]